MGGIAGSGRVVRIWDDSGEFLLGVNPEKCACWALSAWPSDKLTGLKQVILVGDHTSLKQHESKLQKSGWRHHRANGDRSQIYWSSKQFVTHLINIGEQRTPLYVGLQKKSRWWFTRFCWRLKYSANLKWFLIKEIHLGAASAELCRLYPHGLQGDRSPKEIYSDLYHSFQVYVGLKLMRSTVLPIVIAFKTYDKLRYDRAG